MGQGETDPRPWDVLDQADDGGEPITHQLTVGDLTVTVNMQEALWEL